MAQTALVTGASSGIGKALAHQFARGGYNLVVVSKTETHLQNAARELFTKHPNIQVYSIVKDLTKPRACREIFEELRDRKIEVDVLVNDAGIGQRGAFVNIPYEREEELIRLNVEAVTELSKLFLPAMVQRRRGGILNLGSVAGFHPGPLLAVYHATKAYVVSLSEALSDELRDSGVTVTCLCPGATATNFFEEADMTDARIVQNGAMMSAAEVAEAGYSAFQNGERLVVPGTGNKLLTFTRRLIPISLQAKLNRKFYETSEESAGSHP